MHLLTSQSILRHCKDEPVRLFVDWYCMYQKGVISCFNESD